MIAVIEVLVLIFSLKRGVGLLVIKVTRLFYLHKTYSRDRESPTCDDSRSHNAPKQEGLFEVLAEFGHLLLPSGTHTALGCCICY